MTADEWNAATNPADMLLAARGVVAPARLRLVVCEVVGMGRYAHPALDVARRFAAGEGTPEQLAEASEGVRRDWNRNLYDWVGGYTDGYDFMRGSYTHQLCSVPPFAPDPVEAFAAAFGGCHSSGCGWFRPEPGEECDLIRELLGDPFRPSAVDPAWLTSTVRLLAAGVRRDRAFDRLPILADALQDAGCGDEAVLGHCGQRKPHHDGCWVLALLLDRRPHEPGP
jgi:hypothetical protein